jgi:3-oxoacyl-[acyl-carrier-protein] synthase II
MTTQVVVTGLGMTTPVGGDVATTWQNLLAGVSGISVMPEGWPADQPCQIAGLMAVDPAGVLDRVEARKLDRSQQAALVAAREAWAQAGSPAVDPERLGAVISTGMGGLTSLMNSYDILLERGPSRISPHMVTQIMPNGPAAVVGLEVGARAGVHGQVSACASGAEAVSYAARMIQTGRADVVVCGGTEAVIHPITMAGFAAMRALSTRNDDPAGASRPFDQGRDGFVIGEGAGVVVLEAADHAEARGAPILAELAGYGATADASHITLPAPGGIGAVRAARRALEKAGLDPDAIDHVNAHATSTPEGDRAELQAIRSIFGDHAPTVSITANKSMLGHTLGAAGAIEAIVTILSLREGCIPPTINLTSPDEEAVGLDLTPGRASFREIRAAMSNSFGFGGQNTALLFTRWNG